MRFKGTPGIGSGSGFTKSQAFKKLKANIPYELYEGFLLSLDVYAINQAFYAAWKSDRRGFTTPDSLECCEGQVVKWDDGPIDRQDIISFISREALPCRHEIIGA